MNRKKKYCKLIRMDSSVISHHAHLCDKPDKGDFIYDDKTMYQVQSVVLYTHHTSEYDMLIQVEAIYG